MTPSVRRKERECFKVGAFASTIWPKPTSASDVQTSDVQAGAVPHATTDRECHLL